MLSPLFLALLLCAVSNAANEPEFEEEGVPKYPDAEHRLIDDLLKGYNKFAHPKSYSDKNINFTVVFGIEIVQLVAVDDRNQQMITNCWVRQLWTNPALRWNPSHYNNITRIRLSGEKVWIPDILLYNSADTQHASGGLLKYHTQIIIEHDGRHSWYTPTSFISTCRINVRYFPFDHQRCIMKFGSWTFQMNELDIIGDSKAIVTQQYLRSAEWDLIGVRENRNIRKYACCPFPFSDLTITLIISRRPLFYIFNLMIPCFIIIAMVLMGFLLPPESGERTTLSITVLLAMAVFLQLQAEHLPRNSEEIPLLGIFYITVMAEVGLSLMATCYVLNIYHRNSGVHIVPMHPFVSRFFLGTMASILRITLPTSDWNPREPNVERQRPSARRTDKDRKAGSDTEVHLLTKTSDTAEATETIYNGPNDVISRPVRSIHPRHSPSKPSLFHSFSSTTIPAECGNSQPKTTTHCCSVLAESLKKKRAIRLDQERWRHLAMVLDRMFFVLFIIIIAASTMLIYMQVNFNS